MERQGTLVAAVLRQRTFHKKWAESLARCRRRPPFQRHLFNFGASPASKSFTENRVVPFTPEEVFSVVIDVDKYKEFVPFCVESRVTRRDNENKFFAMMGVGFKVIAWTVPKGILVLGMLTNLVLASDFHGVLHI
eukprot:scaffold492_cov257-Pinguiococcus_pyrenoidosus.AAC.30